VLVIIIVVAVISGSLEKLRAKNYLLPLYRTEIKDNLVWRSTQFRNSGTLDLSSLKFSAEKNFAKMVNV
jgi:hypothetical protein